MYIHQRKTTLMMLGSRHNLSANDILQIILDDELIKRVENQKLLGIIIDKNVLKLIVYALISPGA